MSRCLGMLLAAAGALAIDNVHYIRVEHTKNVVIHLSQIAVFDVTNTNVALNKPCSNSEAWSIGKSECWKAIDGSYEMRAFPDMFHSRQNKGWMEVDLQGGFTIQRIEVWDRKDCCHERMEGHIVKFLNDKKELVHSTVLKRAYHQSIAYKLPCTSVKIDGKALSAVPVSAASLSVGSMTLSDIPAILMDSQAFAPAEMVSSGSIELQCCEDTPCAFVISLYKCQGCAGYDGGLRGHLAADKDWAPNSCAPTLTEGPTSHPMVNFRRVLQPKESVSIPITSQLAYITIFQAKGADGALCFRSRNPPKAQGPTLGGNICSKTCAQPLGPA